MKIKIPKIVVEAIDEATFRNACASFRPDHPPKWKIDDICFATRDFGRQTPGLIIGIDPREGGWCYSVVCPRPDGILERLMLGEKQLEKLA